MTGSAVESRRGPPAGSRAARTRRLRQAVASPPGRARPSGIAGTEPFAYSCSSESSSERAQLRAASERRRWPFVAVASGPDCWPST